MRIYLSRTLTKRAPSELVFLHDLWVGGSAPSLAKDLIDTLRRRMSDPSSVATVGARLTGSSESVYKALLNKGGKARHFDEIRTEVARQGISATCVRVALAELVQVGLAANVSTRHSGHTSSLWGIPSELARAAKSAKRVEAPPYELLTLAGWLRRHFRHQGATLEDAAGQAQRMLPFLTTAEAVQGRLDELPANMKAAAIRIALEHGGMLKLSELDNVLDKVQANQFRSALEDASLGTIGFLDLEGFGIRQRGQVVIVFQEVMLACMKMAASSQPITPSEIASIGVDFVSNFDRFANFVDDETVRFTVRGTIYKSTGKRLAERLLPNPGLEFGRLEILEMEYRFALAFRYIDRTGERSFRVTQTGKEFLAQPLSEKQRTMLDCLVEDRDMPGDVAHQLPMRRLVLRVLKHFEPNQWVDAMAVPFLARSVYLATLQGKESDGVEQTSFPVRSSADLNSLAWNLFTWVRKHLYVLGLVDMGYDEGGRACAIRLTGMGAEFLGMLPATDLSAAGHIVVNPDFEVVLFPGERSHELIYELDRFADREKSDSLYHYRITPASLHRALSEGMDLDSILKLLAQLSRTPLPQNVEYSLESWARSDGMVVFDPQQFKLLCESSEILDRISLHPELGRIGLEREDAHTLRICGTVDVDPLTDWIRDYGVSVRIAS
jgi:hypothetical protein